MTVCCGVDNSLHTRYAIQACGAAATYFYSLRFLEMKESRSSVQLDLSNLAMRCGPVRTCFLLDEFLMVVCKQKHLLIEVSSS